MNLVVLESPWQLGQNDFNRQSIIPYFSALSQNNSRVRMYSRMFYDRHTLTYALSDVMEGGAGQCILYVAAHGQNGRIGTPEGFQDVQLSFLLNCMAAYPNRFRGLMLGCCHVGGNENLVEYLARVEGLDFCFGYNCAIHWYLSTMIDLSFVKVLSEHNVNYMARNGLIHSLDFFSGTFRIDDGRNDGGELVHEPVSLSESFLLYEATDQGLASVEHLVRNRLGWGLDPQE